MLFFAERERRLRFELGRLWIYGWQATEAGRTTLRAIGVVARLCTNEVTHRIRGRAKQPQRSRCRNSKAKQRELHPLKKPEQGFRRWRKGWEVHTGRSRPDSTPSLICGRRETSSALRRCMHSRKYVSCTSLHVACGNSVGLRQSRA